MSHYQTLPNSITLSQCQCPSLSGNGHPLLRHPTCYTSHHIFIFLPVSYSSILISETLLSFSSQPPFLSSQTPLHTCQPLHHSSQFLHFIQTSFLSSQPLPFNPNPSSIHPINISPLFPSPPPSVSSSILGMGPSTTIIYRIHVHPLHHLVTSPNQQCFL